MTIKEICGCTHLHTTFSDGSCGYETLVDAALDAALDYVCVTDHMNLEGRRTGWEGLHGALFVLVGYEHEDDKNLNHYLVFGVDEVAKGLTDPQDYINRVRESGGTGFIAHPAEKRSRFKSLPPYPWVRWDAQGFDGIEIWNQISDWMERLGSLQTPLRVFFPNRFLNSAPKELLERWDELNRDRFVSAIGGVDAHTRKIHIGPFNYVIFPIKVELRGVRTHLFVDGAEWTSGQGGADNKRMGAALISAMRDGRGFISNFGRGGDARGSTMYLSDSGGAIQYPGRASETRQQPSFPLTMNVQLTQKAKILLLRNGKVIRSVSAKTAAWPVTEPGAYRVEAHRCGGVWIYSNHFPVGRYPL